MAALNRMLRLGIKSESCLASLRAYSTSSSPIHRFNCRQFSQLVKSNGTRACLVDTLAMVRSLEAQGVPSKLAEAITSAIIEVLNDSLKNVAHSFVSKVEMQKTEIPQESNLSKFKSEVTSSQEHLFQLQRETEKLRTDIDKMHSELNYEINKRTAEKRWNLYLERGRIHDEVANENAETTNLTNKLDREILAVRAQLKVAKYDMMLIYCFSSFFSTYVGLAILRILM